MHLQAKRVITVVDDDFEDLELMYPHLRLQEEGAEMLIAGRNQKTYTGKYGVPVTADLTFREAVAEQFDAVLVPGGWAPDKLRRDKNVLDIVKKANEKERVIGQICHAGWVLISAGILDGRTVTSTPGIKDDIMNAGAEWLDEETVIDKNIVSSRRPPDLPAYGRALIRQIAKQS